MPDKDNHNVSMYESILQRIYAPYVYEHIPDLSRLEEKIDALNRRLDLIFGDHVLINGRFVSIKKLEGEGNEKADT